MTDGLINPFGRNASLTRGFYFQGSVYYQGVHRAGDYVKEWPVATRGAPVMAAGDGWAYAQETFDFYRGWMVTVRVPISNYEWVIVTAHLASFNIPVGVWVPVKQGDVVGFADNTGVSSGDHLHVDCGCTKIISNEAVWRINVWAHDPEIHLEKRDPIREEDEMQLLGVAAHPNGWALGWTPERGFRPIVFADLLMAEAGVAAKKMVRFDLPMDVGNFMAAVESMKNH